MAIVSTMIGDCPGCGGKACFGNALVTENVLGRGCTHCKYWESIQLPPLRKKIIYLDQSLLSAAFKEGDHRAVETVARLSELASRQLLVAPHSDVHEDETHGWAGYDGRTPEQLMEFIKKAARGVRFKTSYEIERLQTYKCFRAFEQGAPVKYRFGEREAFPDDPHAWHNYVYITLQRPLLDLTQACSRKVQAAEQLVDAFEGWRSSTSSFEEDLASEIRDAGQCIVQQYLEYIRRIADGNLEAIWTSTRGAEQMQGLLLSLPRDLPRENALTLTIEFLKSSYFAEVPYLNLSARIFALLRQLARQGAYPRRSTALNKLGGTLNDIRHIATYAPYCDVIFVDNTMADILSKPTVGLRERHGTLVYSLNSLDELHAWLDRVEASATDEHLDWLRRVYGNKL